MNPKTLALLLIVWVCFMASVYSQEIAPVYSARAYWLEQNNPRYQQLLIKQSKGDSLLPAELEWVHSYKQYLEGYYLKLPDSEKQLYQEKAQQWTELKQPSNRFETESKEPDKYSDVGDKSIYTKYLFYSGYYGFYYGLVLNNLFDISGPAAAGIPFLSAGTCVLLPMLDQSNKKMSDNSLMLGLHGKTVGWIHGFALSALVIGDLDNSNKTKFAFTLSAMSSIGLGYLGKKLGMKDNWTEGRVALYRHYGLLAPFSGASFLLAANVQDNRLMGAGILASGMAGYFISDRISNRIDFTRGDILALKNLTLLNGGLGLGIWLDAGDAQRSYAYLPAIGAISGTLLGQAWLKNYNLTVPIARKISYATIGGSLIGEGIALMVNSNVPTPYYLIPWLTGFVSFTFAVENLKSKPLAFRENKNRLLRNWTADFEPQNLIIGTRFNPKNGASPLSFRVQPPPALTLRYSIQ